MKICRTCKIEKSDDSFYSTERKNKTYLNPDCKKCEISKRVEKNKNPELKARRKELRKGNRDKDSYRLYWPGLPISEARHNYSKLFEQQLGCCMICERHQSILKKILCVDHCHATGKIRGLLCDECNKGLGQFRDNKNLLLKAVEYLNKTGF